MATYTVKEGDCLWDIAKAKLGSGTRWQEIATLNTSKYPSLKNSTVIQVGWVLELPGSSSGTTKKTTASNVAVVEFLGPLAGENRTLFLTWSWSKSGTEKYLIEWIYTVEGNRTLYATQTVSVDAEFDAAAYKQTTWNVPENAVTIKVKVKPVAKKTEKDGKETTPWTAGWSTITSKAMYFGDKFPPDAPSAPSVKLDGDTLTLSLDVAEWNATDKVAFQVLEDYKKYIVVVNNVPIKNGRAAYTCKLSPGKTYVARCRICKRTLWSEYSPNTSEIITRPVAPKKLTAKALTENDVYLEWTKVANVTGYEYQYTTKKEYFDTSSQVTSGNVGNTVNCANIIDIPTGNVTYFFRVRAQGEGGDSDWSNIVSLTLGKAPAAPTTWSSTTTAVVGKPVSLYWVHNSEDGSSQTYAKIELTVNGAVQEPITVKNEYENEEDRDNTSEYILDTSSYSEGAKILWRVCTAGVLTDKYGEWSVQREIEVNAQPTINLRVTKNLEGEALDDLTSFPFYVEASAEPATQLPIGYHLTVVANEGYETVDYLGNPIFVSAGDAVYSKYFSNDFEINGVASTSLFIMLTPDMIDLENNISYTLTCTVSMNSGLTAEDSVIFTVAWEDISYVPNAEIGYDPETYSTIVRPYCEDVDGNLIDGVVLSLYRREYDGRFTLIETNIPNNGYTFVTDPHPALDYARYRVVATVEETGAIGFYDIPGYPIGESGAIIQWNEDWSNFDAVESEPLATPSWTGSLIRLPYNIDISPSNAKDIALVEYIGREHPVAYYGTQLGESVSLKTDIPATDRETLYALRRLMIWKGDAYVRLPNGIGHWATVSVQYSENHNDVKIPVTIDITRVEGGV